MRNLHNLNKHLIFRKLTHLHCGEKAKMYIYVFFHAYVLCHFSNSCGKMSLPGKPSFFPQSIFSKTPHSCICIYICNFEKYISYFSFYDVYHIIQLVVSWNIKLTSGIIHNKYSAGGIFSSNKILDFLFFVFVLFFFT